MLHRAYFSPGVESWLNAAAGFAVVVALATCIVMNALVLMHRVFIAQRHGMRVLQKAHVCEFLPVAIVAAVRKLPETRIAHDAMADAMAVQCTALAYAQAVVVQFALALSRMYTCNKP
jgi:hypothetical protein